MKPYKRPVPRVETPLEKEEVKTSVVTYRIPLFNFSTIDIEKNIQLVEQTWASYGLDPIAFDIYERRLNKPDYGPVSVRVSPKSKKYETYYTPKYDTLLREFPKPAKTALVLVYSYDQWETAPTHNRAQGVEQRGYISLKLNGSSHNTRYINLEDKLPEDVVLLIHELCHFFCDEVYGIPDTIHDSEYEKHDVSITLKQIKEAQDRVKIGLQARLSYLETLYRQLLAQFNSRKI